MIEDSSIHVLQMQFHALSQIGVPTWAAHYPGHLCEVI